MCFYLDFSYFYVQDVNQELLPRCCNLQFSVLSPSLSLSVSVPGILQLKRSGPPCLTGPQYNPHHFDLVVSKLAESSPTWIIIYI